MPIYRAANLSFSHSNLATLWRVYVAPGNGYGLKGEVKTTGRVALVPHAHELVSHISTAEVSFDKPTLIADHTITKNYVTITY